jgi:hypothetical protein
MNHSTFCNQSYPGDKAARLILERLKGCLYWYQTIYGEKKFEILFSNGRIITFKFRDSSVLHVMGFNLKDLVQYGFCSKGKINPYLVLNKLANNGRELIRINKDHNYGLIDFNKIQNKIEALLELTDFDSFNFAGLVFDRNIARSNNYFVNMKSNYFLFNASQEGNQCIPMLGVNADQGYVETVFNCEKINQPFKFSNQAIAYPLFMREYQNDVLLSEKFISEEERGLLNQMISDICREYACSVDDEYYFSTYPTDISKLQRKPNN